MESCNALGECPIWRINLPKVMKPLDYRIGGRSLNVVVCRVHFDHQGKSWCPIHPNWGIPYCPRLPGHHPTPPLHSQGQSSSKRCKLFTKPLKKLIGNFFLLRTWHNFTFNPLIWRWTGFFTSWKTLNSDSFRVSSKNTPSNKLH